MGFIKEFKEFAVRGNVIDMAVGVVIGGAFGKIVSSLVADVIMPAVGIIVGGINFSDLKVILKQASMDAAGKEIPAVTLNYGNFIQMIFDFIIIAFAIFIFIKAINKIRSSKEAEAPAVPTPSKEELLLTEIRDLLKENKK